MDCDHCVPSIPGEIRTEMRLENKTPFKVGKVYIFNGSIEGKVKAVEGDFFLLQNERVLDDAKSREDVRVSYSYLNMNKITTASEYEVDTRFPFLYAE